MKPLRSASNNVIYALARLQKKLRLNAIRDSKIHDTSVIEAGSQVVTSNIDRHSFCGYDCVIINASIGSFCSIADRVYIGGSHHPMHYVSTSPVFLAHRDSVKAKFSRHVYRNFPPTEIGHDVWIGFDAKIRAGVCIGSGAVVGMGSVVTKDVSPYTIVAGVPARPIGRRFEDEISNALLRSEWWTYSDERLREVAADFTAPEIFLQKLGLL